MAGPKKTVLKYKRDVPEIEDRDPTLPPDQHLRKKPDSNEIEIADGPLNARNWIVVRVIPLCRRKTHLHKTGAWEWACFNCCYRFNTPTVERAFYHHFGGFLPPP